MPLSVYSMIALYIHKKARPRAALRHLGVYLTHARMCAATEFYEFHALVMDEKRKRSGL